MAAAEDEEGVRVTGKYVTPVDWSGRGAGPSIVHPPPSTHIPPDTPTVISIGPLSHRPPERVDVPKEEEPSVGEDWSRSHLKPGRPTARWASPGRPWRS
ncbi:hypothetical protein INR49_001847 [Caranx melampygus]|nr:hypothetical protein INR49_001847 [Caranx melampygus]